MRTCSICGHEKSLEEFEKNSKKKHGRGYRCNSCNRNRRKHPNKSASLIACEFCGTEFKEMNKHQRFCSMPCNNKSRKQGSKHRWFTNMLSPKRVSAGLTTQILLDLYERQQGRCALTGVEMTFHVGGGGLPTNVSIDRLEAGAPYTLDNVQLVCKAVNSFRNNLSIEEFKWWCKKVAEY